jgi:hypothetical protein
VSVLRVISGSLEDGTRRGFVYGGDLLVFKKVPPMKELCAFVDGMIREVLGTGDPVKAQFGMDRDEYLSRVEALQRRPRNYSSGRSGTLGWISGAPSGTRCTCASRPTAASMPVAGRPL